jgi:polysaccharide pyruvyl transferase WcaK-like protein
MNNLLFWNKRVMRLRSLFPHRLTIGGNYSVHNVGDRAIAYSFYKGFINKRIRSSIVNYDVFQRYSSGYRILGGGGTLHDINMKALLKRAEFVKGNNYSIIGVGVPNVVSNEGIQIVKQLVENADVCTVRDELSKSNLVNIGISESLIEVTADPALTLNPPAQKVNYKIGVNIKPVFSPEDNRSNEEYIKYFGYPNGFDKEKAYLNFIRKIQEICAKLEDAVFISFGPADEQFASKYLDMPILETKGDVVETMKAVASVEKMICTRYHALVFAIVNKVPVYSISYDPKVKELADKVNIDSVSPLNIDSEKIKFKTPENTQKLIESAHANFEKVMDWL